MPLIAVLKSAECGALFKDTGPSGRTANSATVENPSRLLPVMAIAQTNVRLRARADIGVSDLMPTSCPPNGAQALKGKDLRILRTEGHLNR
jgi:hypothetical protein